ncbi:SPBc2 prophage-derived glycosyltransferase SunS [Oxobacter pfennigii]|uniref:SPBc2 prophage-derived glycosyltransferase SunS n=1 Tax=Oxobacter pfennigii TaxID=36849 RepID=A0A0P9AGU9_9CLOT|nr:glycosyltransferase family 2 protein [Oxobacter pfennigii]KPU44668.1 SPBc2 prophage-derived glycosyltransferase SunS [Oxobacter pfennigii]
MISISACMIVKNEEDNIERCINSYKDIVNEIIVVDTGSTDRTVDIAKKNGCKVFFYKWDNDFASAKNYAIKEAKGDWIIFLDADEYFDYQLSQNIPQILESADENVDGLACTMINIDKNGDIIDETIHLRIFRNKKQISYKNKIHEVLSKLSGTIEAKKVERNALVIYHTGYDRDFMKIKGKRNLKLLLEQEEKGQFDYRTAYYISECYYAMEQYEQAEEYSKAAIEKSNNEPFFSLIKMYQNLLYSMFTLERPEREIKQYIDESKDKFSYHPACYFFDAWYNINIKRYDIAVDSYRKVIEVQNNYNARDINFVPSVIYDIHYKIGEISFIKNDYTGALDSFVKSLRFKKYFFEALIGLIKLIKHESQEDSIVLLNSIYDINNEKDMDFLVDALINQKSGIMLAYYNNIRIKKFGKQDAAIMYTMLSNRKYDKAYEMFYQCYSEDSISNVIFSVISAICSNNTDNMLELAKKVGPSFKRILDNYSENNLTEFIYEDKEDYIMVLDELITLNEHEVLNKYVGLKRYFKKDISLDIGNVLKANGLFNFAIEEYQYYIKNNSNDNKYKGGILASLGYSYYRLKDTNNAIIYFEKALNMNTPSSYNINEILSYVNWSIEKINNKEIVDKLKTLKSKCEILIQNIQFR